MHSTMINILKTLYSTKISKENLAHNLEIKESGLLKNVNSINEFLKDLKVNQIEIENGVLKLKLTKNHWSKVFKKIDTLTFEEKVDYLYIKLVYYEFINLEEERKLLDISRSSINRCFTAVKELLENHGSHTIYSTGKGSKLVSLSEANKHIFIVKLMKLILEEDILTPIQRDLLNGMKDFLIKIRLTKLVAIYKCLKLPITTTLLSFLCALDIYSKRFQDNIYIIEESDEKKLEKIKRIKNVVDTIGGINFTERYKETLVYYMYSIAMNKHYYFEDRLNKSNDIIEELFKVTKIYCEDLKKFLLQQLYFGMVKKEFNIFILRNVELNSEDFILLNLFDKILEKYSQKLNICDKYLIISYLKKEIIKKNIIDIEKILIMVGEVNTLRQLSLEKELKFHFPKIKFSIDYNYLNLGKKNKKNYNLVIDDSKSTLREGDVFYRIKKAIERSIIRKIIIES
ncbi:BglG family transcription antiterminator [Candidatus Cetobacterium colombiensis]|uniref:Mga helix-turn-helix domain-containing protein n=1 Tax=Candidatus Cetobacterium colombiensis TaxID=3073100 RepID=A0ABU4WBK7_9FUSO|nr:hypothetical protein [Candidatus Cetobacterium colombiensis]MDX8336604.1 hypothetical protein [Candidatus Cetobacterium colombiensis]